MPHYVYAFSSVSAFLADELLKRDHAQAFLVSLSDEAGRALEDILAGRIIPDGEGFYPISVSPEGKYGFEAGEITGYTLLRRTDWREEEDERVHITGIMISEDLLSLFRELETKEITERRLLYNALKECCALAASYYAVAPFSLIRRLYQVLRKENPDLYPDPDEEEFDRLMLDYCSDKKRFEQMIHYRGINYVSSIYEEEELTDEMDGDDSYVAGLLIKQREAEYDFYLPSAAEIKDNYRKGFPCGKKCYRDLEQFIREAFLDEKYMSDMQSSMFRMVINDPDDDWGKKSYSMDLVEKNTEEHLADLLFSIKDGYGPLNVFRDEKDFYAPFREEAKERYRELLIACFDEMNEPWFLGHTNREVREQGFDDPWDLSEPGENDNAEKED